MAPPSYNDVLDSKLLPYIVTYAALDIFSPPPFILWLLVI